MLTRRIIVTLLALALPVAAYAANSSLSNLSAGSAISSTDLFYDVQTAGAGGVKVTGTQFEAFIFGKVGGGCTATSGGSFTCTGSPAGSNTQLQYNNSGSLGAITGVTSTGTAITVANGDLILSGASSGSSTIEAPSSGGGTVTFFVGSDTVAGLGTSETFSGNNTFSGNLTFSGLTSGTQTKCLGLTSGNAVVANGAACGSGGGGTPGGSNTQVQYNNSGAFGGISGVASNGTTMTFASTALILQGSSSGTTTLNAASVAGTTTATLPDNTGTIAEVNLSQTWSAAQAFNSGNLQLNGSSSGTITLNAPSAAGSNTLTLQAATDTIVARATTDTLTNKTITSSTDSLGGVTAAFGSDAKGDIYINSGSSNVIERLAIGTTNQCLIVTSGLPAWGSCGAGGTPGGSNTDVQFNNSSSFGGDSGFTYAGSGQATLALGTITSNAEALNITATWNNGSTTFDAPLFMNITNTASGSGSLLADLQVGGSSKFSVDKTGAITNAGGLTTGTVSLDPTFGVGSNAGYAIGGANVLNRDSGTGDTYLHATSSGANALIQSNSGVTNIIGPTSTSAQTLRVYNTSDVNFGSPTNYERGAFDWTTNSNVLTIGTQKGGTGSTRNVEFVVGGTKELDFGVTTASTWTMQGNFNAPGLASLSASTTAYVCWTTSTGAISEDSATCLSSLRKLKDNITPFSGATDELMALKPSTFNWKQPIDFNQRGTQLGFIAEDVASVDRKLASYSSDGSLHGWQDEGMIALLVRGFQEQQAEIEELKRHVR